MDVLLGRQPIFNDRRNVVAYKLLYSDPGVADEASASQLVATALLDLGLTRLVGDRPAYVPCPERFLRSHAHLLLPKEQIVLEVCGGTPPTPETVDILADARQRGYAIALNNFVFNDQTRPLLQLANIVKIEVNNNGDDSLREVSKALNGSSVRRLAEKVETPDRFEACRQLGFELFQGYFFARPHLVADKSVPAVRWRVLELMSALANDEVDFGELGELISHDVALSVRLLRYINSAAVGLAREVTSIRSAISLLGLSEIRRWVRVILLSRLTVDKPSELMTMALVRARFCELSACGGMGKHPEAFTAGLFSLLDAMLDRPMSDILEQLALQEDIRAALLGAAGDLTDTLKLTIAMEAGDFDTALDHADGRELSRESLRMWYLEACRYAHELMRLSD